MRAQGLGIVRIARPAEEERVLTGAENEELGDLIAKRLRVSAPVGDRGGQEHRRSYGDSEHGRATHAFSGTRMAQ
jgi:hypothetical protein